jgi:hypothetical protein
MRAGWNFESDFPARVRERGWPVVDPSSLAGYCFLWNLLFDKAE